VGPFGGDGDTDALLTACGQGDEAAFARLYRVTAPKLFGVLLRILRREDWAQEVLQEVYVTVWQHAGEYTASRGAAMAWLTRIARNRALDWWRRSRNEIADPDADLASIPDDAPHVETTLAADQDARRLQDCLARLGERQRRAVQMAYFEGLSHSELAARLEAPIGSVKTWIRRGLLALKECLGP